MNLRESALLYAEHGLPVFPLKPNSKEPKPGSNGFYSATLSAVSIDSWWNQNIRFNIGIRPPQGTVVLDVDSEEAYHGILGRGWDIPKTHAVKTPRGYHFWYLHDSNSFNTKANILNLQSNDPLYRVDAKGPGSYVVAPPSRTSFGQYFWSADVDWPHFFDDMADAPEWLVKALASAQMPSRVDEEKVLQGLPQGERNDEIFRLACKLRRDNMPQGMARVLLEKAASECQPPLPKREVENILKSAWRYTPDPRGRYSTLHEVKGQGGRFVRLSEVKRDKIEWLWKPRIPKREITLLAGPGGIGKSICTTALVAGITTGSKLPDSYQSLEPSTAILFSAEDEIDRVILPRLEAQGADLSRVIAYEIPQHGMTLDSEGIMKIMDGIIDHKPGLVVIDPIVSFAGQDRDLFRAEQVRSIMDSIVRMAKVYNTTFLVVAHVTKKGSIYASVDFVNACRSVLKIYEDPEDESCRYLAHYKTNYSDKADSLRFQVVGHQFKWIGPNKEWTSEALESVHYNPQDRILIEQAETLLKESIGKPTWIVLRDARGQGLPAWTVKTAERRLGLEIVKDDEDWKFQRKSQGGRQAMQTVLSGEGVE